MLPNPQETANLVTLFEEVHNEKLHFFVQCLMFDLLSALSRSLANPLSVSIGLI